MPKELIKLIEGLRWLAEVGRPAAQQLQLALAEDETINFEECFAWFEDIEQGNDI